MFFEHFLEVSQVFAPIPRVLRKFFKKFETFENIFFSNKKNSLFLNIRNMQFNQSFPVQPNPEKKNLEKSQKSLFFQEK